MADSINAYRDRTKAEHRAAFDLWLEVVHLVEPAISGPLASPSFSHLALQMLALQSFNSFAAVALLAQHGLMEDTATAARRLMEIGVQAAYIGLESDTVLREKRAGTYIAFMWRQLPRSAKHQLPSHIRAWWSEAARKYGRAISPKAKQWYGKFRDVCTAVGAEEMYVEDYSLLSLIAHGSSDDQIVRFSRQKVKLRSTRFVSILLAYASRYQMMTTAAWNSVHEQISDEAFDRLSRRVTEFDPRATTKARSAATKRPRTA